MLLKGVPFCLSQISCTFQFHDAYSIPVMAPEVFRLAHANWRSVAVISAWWSFWGGVMRWCCILGWHLSSAGMWECDNQLCRLTRADMQAPCCLQSFGRHRSAFVSGLQALESRRLPGSRQQPHPESLQLSLQLAASLQKPACLSPEIKQRTKCSGGVVPCSQRRNPP